MIDLYVPAGDTDSADFAELWAKGRTLLGRRRGNADDAIRALFTALRDTHVREDDYARAAALLRDAFVRSERPREAITVAWYLRDEIPAALLAAAPPVDRARAILRRPGTNAAREAAAAFEAAGLLVKAAIAYERAEAWEEARALWSRLAPSLAASSSLYEASLAAFNLCRVSLRLGDARTARQAGTQAVHLVEEAADRFESSGQRERAFDCYQVLLGIGRETKIFEHVLEGYVNVLRILSEDHLRFYALQTYGEAVAAARAEGELVAAATLAREMGAYARREAEPATAIRAGILEAELWRAAATSTLAHGGSPARAEHALLASVLALAENGQFRAVAEVYEELSRICADDRRRAHYAKAVARYAGARDERIDAGDAPAPKGDIAFPDVWHVDLIEWEERGSAAEACADVLLDTSSYADVTRRRAMLARLVALAAEDPEDRSRESLVLLANALTTLELYAALSPLETLAHSSEASVREAAVRALSRFLYKRTFVTIRERLDDPDAAVARAAADTLERLVFAQAIDPLSRIFREARDGAARHASLRALAKIERPEAAEMLLSVVAYGTPADREAATSALEASRGTAFVAAARAAMPGLPAHAREAVRAALEARQLA